MKYVSKFTDRHGHERAYFRRPGCVSVPLPTPIGGPEFLAAYDEALADTGHNTKPPKAAGRDWSGRRLAMNVRETMADTGVYLLTLKGRVVYVGSSKNCAERIAQHRKNGRYFEKAFYIFAEESERIQLERALILAIAPEQNSTYRASNPGGVGKGEASNPA